jgi:hypothetical protein
MFARVTGFLKDIFHGVIKEVRDGQWLGCWIGGTGLDGSNPLLILVHVTLLQFCGDGDVVECLL